MKTTKGEIPMNNNSCGYPLQRQSGRDEHCECLCSYSEKSAFPENTPLAMAFVPFQGKSEKYKCEKALSRGTLFPCLDKPFMMGCCK